MATIWLPKQESALMSSLQKLFDTVFCHTLGEINIDFQQWDEPSINIQFSEFKRLEFDVYTNDVHWFKPSKLIDDSSIKRIYSIKYNHDIPNKISPENLFTVFIRTAQVNSYQVSERWNDESGMKSLYSRNTPQKSIVPLEHLSWLILLSLYDFSFDDSLVIARSAINVSRETWPVDIKYFPTVINQAELKIQPFLPIDPEKFHLYPVVDSYEWIEKLTGKYDIQTAQLRIKDPKSPELESQIEQVSELSRTSKKQLFINDYWQAAIKYRSYGVHLGQEDLDTTDLDLIRNANLRLGISTHGYYEILKAESVSPSYIALGHIYPTTTKDMPSKPQGIIRLALYQKLINSIGALSTDIPTVAIGGIDLKNAESVLDTGVSSIAVVRAITKADNLTESIAKFHSLIDAQKCQECVV